jgi:type I restriction enzyme S subunit
VINLPVPFASIDEQDAIISNIDRLFAEIEGGEAALAEARLGVDTYRKALLQAAVTGELTKNWRSDNPTTETGQDLLRRILTDRRRKWEADPRNRTKRHVEPSPPATDNLPDLPEGWTWATLQQLGDFGRGKSKHRPRNDPRLYGGSYPFIQTGIVAASQGKIERYDQTYSELGLAQSKLWPIGTVCITIAANIAMTGVLTFEACFPDSIVGLSCHSEISPAYVELFIRTARERLDRYAPATAQKNINLETLYGLAVPLPPASEQRRIVELCENGENLDFLALPEHFDNQTASLRQSILSAAFRGELLE